MKLFTFPLENRDPADAFTAVANQPYSLLFDSADRRHADGRCSFVVFQPFETITARGRRITVTNRDQQLSFDGDPFIAVRQRLAVWNMAVAPRDDLPPFQGGAAGFFGYGLAAQLEKLPALPGAQMQPDMAVGLYDTVAAFDHRDNAACLIVLAPDDATAQTKAAQARRLLSEHNATNTTSYYEPVWRSSFTRNAYEAAVARTIDYIKAGDIFQANLSQRFTADLPPGFDTFAHYRQLRQVNPAPFAAYMNFGGFRLSSASPERFLSVRHGRVETRPIKGTRPRAADPARDEALRRELAASEKDRAENIMIVDLMRNDLSKVCDDFSVDASQLCALESFAAVHHLVSTVTGTLRADQTPVNLLRACFPGGSITGAPKIRAMQIIAELEGAARGPYCGAMGYIGFNGAMDVNIAIRTLVYQDDSVSFNAGGGITADSDPAAEYQETLDKAAAIFASFACAQRREAA